MRRALVLIVTVLVSLLFSSCSSAKHVSSKTADISPYSYGLATAKSDVERYQVLLETHRAAIKAGVNVDYTGIDTIRLEIPENPKHIPLTQYNDFKGCVFFVNNTIKNVYLFDKRIDGAPITVEKRLIDSGDFRSVEALNKGRCLLLIEDEIPWVINRKGYSNGHNRKDILLLEGGKAQNTVIRNYNNSHSTPKCSYIKLNNDGLTIKNLTFERNKNSSFITNLIFVSGFDNVSISNIIVRTPENSLSGDHAIGIYNCTNVSLDDVCIEGTYSQKDHYGYGIILGNIWNFKATKLYGKANWGIFGSNDVNTVFITDSKINRFDIHSYGKDVSFGNVDFFDLYNQYSSVYGTIVHDSCTFTDFVPVRNGGSYNSYVAHDIVFNNCVFNVSPDKNCVFKLSLLNELPNARYELSEKCLPNVKINNMVVNLKNGAKDFVFFNCTSSGKKVSDIGYLSNIEIDGLTINSDGETPVNGMTLSNINIQTKNPVDCQMKNVMVNQPRKDVLTKAASNEAVLKTNMSIKGGKVTLKNVKNLKQE